AGFLQPGKQQHRDHYAKRERSALSGKQDCGNRLGDRRRKVSGAARISLRLVWMALAVSGDGRAAVSDRAAIGCGIGGRGRKSANKRLRGRSSRPLYRLGGQFSVSSSWPSSLSLPLNYSPFDCSSNSNDALLQLFECIE